MACYLSSRMGITIMVVLMLFGSTGCAKNDADRTRGEGAAAGAVIGGVIGQVVGGDTGATLVGAAIGAIAGTVFGDHVAKDKAAMVQEEDHLLKLADSAKKRAAETAEFNSQLQREIAMLQKTNKRLNSKLLAAKERNRLMVARNTRADMLRCQAKEQIDKVNQDLALLQEELKKAQIVSQGDATQPQQSQSASLQLVANETSSLDKEREALTHAVEQLQLIDTRRD